MGPRLYFIFSIIFPPIRTVLPYLLEFETRAYFSNLPRIRKSVLGNPAIKLFFYLSSRLTGKTEIFLESLQDLDPSSKSIPNS